MLSIIKEHSEQRQVVLKSDTDELFAYAVNAYGVLVQARGRTTMSRSA